MRKQSKRYLFLVFSLAALLIGLSGTSVAFAQGRARSASSQKAASQTCGTWSVVTSPNPPDSGYSQLQGVAAVSSSDVWAVGYYDNLRNGLNQTLIERWNGTSWSVVSSPNAGTSSNLLFGVAAVSASDVWAVGYYYTSSDKLQTLIEQWNGTNWSVVASPNLGTNDNQLSGVAVVSANDVWAVGDYFNTNTGITRNLTLNWNGTSWNLVPPPDAATSSNQLNGVAAASASDVWAAGDYFINSGSNSTPRTSTVNFNGTKWSRVSSPNVGGGDILYSVAAVSTSDVWAVGENGNTLTLNWNGTSWSVVSSTGVSMDTNQLFGVAAASANDVWAVGESVNSSADTLTLIEQWNGTSWSIVSSPNPSSFSNQLFGVAVSNGDVWAVGTYYGSTGQTLIEFYC